MENLITTHTVQISISKGRKDASYFTEGIKVKGQMWKKKPFIEKKKAVSFHLVHRSQRDPLAADETAPQRVLLPTQKVGPLL